MIIKEDIIFRESAQFISKKALVSAITISPPEREWTEESYLAMWADIQMNALAACSDYIIVPELSEDNRLHFHGVIKFQCKGHKETYFDKRFRYQKVLKKYGSILHKTNVNKGWIDYMWKDWIKTSDKLPGINIIRKGDYVTCPYEWNDGYAYESDEDDQDEVVVQVNNIKQADFDFDNFKDY